MTARSRSTMPGSFQRRSIAWKPPIPSWWGGPASIRPRPGTDLSFISTHEATGHGGQGPQEVDVAEYRRVEDGGVMTAEQDRPVEARNGHPDRGAVPREIKEVRQSDIEPYTGLRYLSKLFRFMAIIL